MSNTLKNNPELIDKLLMLVRGKGMRVATAARQLGLKPRTCQEFFAQTKNWMRKYWKDNEDNINRYFNGFNNDNTPRISKPTNQPRVLLIDIETAPLLGSVWSLWNNNLSLAMVERDWYILSYSAKWLDEDEVIYSDKRESWATEDDKFLLEEIHALLSEADWVITQNGVKFDIKKINARFVMNGMKPPSSYRVIDTMLIAKECFGFTSNKLEYMTDKLCKKYKKLKHGKYAGFELWKECLHGNMDAWREMEEYNTVDVLSMEELFWILRPWSKKLPNVNHYHNEDTGYCMCGNDEWEHTGFHYTAVSKFSKFQCTSCGSEMRDRVNLFSKDKRMSLLTNLS